MHVLRRKIHTFLHTPRIIMKKFSSSPLFKFVPDEMALKIQYKNIFLKELNLENPKTFNEKLQWLKLYDRRTEYITMVDKYAVKQYVADIIGEEYVIPTFGVWDRFEDIDFETLPDQFVLKCTHGSGDVVICRDKKSFDKEYARQKLTKSLQTDYYKISREWPYKNVPRRIIAEKYLGAEYDLEDIPDYKMMCFNGVVECSFVCSKRFSSDELHVTVFDKNWNIMLFERSHPVEKEGIEKPEQYEKMIELAETLSQMIPFVRVDFYEIKQKVYFGELTFYPGSGFEVFKPEIWDEKLGNLIQLPEQKIIR